MAVGDLKITDAFFFYNNYDFVAVNTHEHSLALVNSKASKIALHTSQSPMD